jgi:hypothetical protein
MKIDYNLKILGEKKVYSPRPEFISPIVNSKSKIFEITAGNGYGKTFLLNLIGYACFADKLDDKYILKSLKESISRYEDRTSYELEYNLNFSLPNGKKLTLMKEHEGERTFTIDGKTGQDFSELHKRISVLYDVPTDPSERLNAVIKDIGIWNFNLLQKITKYWEYLRGVQSDFNNVKDEVKISSYKESITNLEIDIASKNLAVIEIRKLINQLGNYRDLDTLILEYKNITLIKEKLLKDEGNFKPFICKTLK